METDQLTNPNTTVFLQTVSVALTNLKQQLQHDYERAYPETGRALLAPSIRIPASARSLASISADFSRCTSAERL